MLKGPRAILRLGIRHCHDFFTAILADEYSESLLGSSGWECYSARARRTAIMTVNLPDDLLSLVRAEVRSGRFASEKQMIAAAIRDYLNRHGQQTQPDFAAESDA